jgi:hypothetical protein
MKYQFATEMITCRVYDGDLTDEEPLNAYIEIIDNKTYITDDDSYKLEIEPSYALDVYSKCGMQEDMEFLRVLASLVYEKELKEVA